MYTMMNRFPLLLIFSLLIKINYLFQNALCLSQFIHLITLASLL